jgi:hypothetical protein
MPVLASTTEAGMTGGRLNQTVYLSTSVQDFHKSSKGRHLVTSEEAILLLAVVNAFPASQ